MWPWLQRALDFLPFRYLLSFSIEIVTGRVQGERLVFGLILQVMWGVLMVLALAPGTPETPVQFIDVRDLAGLVLHAIDTGCHGPMNATSPPGAISIGALLQTCADVAGTAPALRWVSAKDVERCGLAPWSDLPVWVPPVGDHAAMHRTSTARAQAAGLRTRELRDTVAATLAWYRSLPSDRQAFTKAGLSPAREAEALAALNGAPR